MTGPEPLRRRSPLATKVGRLAGLAVDAAISHTKSHCCDGDAKTGANRPGGQTQRPPGEDSPPKYLPEITEFSARPAVVRCRPSFTDAVGAVVITYVSPTNGLAIQATAARHVVAGQPYGANAMAFGVGVQPSQVTYGANDVVAQMDYPSTGPARGCYLGSVSGATATGIAPTLPVIIYVDGVS